MKGASWDIVVRLSHWVIAGVVVLNALITSGGGAVHVALGWTGGAFLVLRMIWGIIGRAEARFSAFPPAPAKALAHLIEVVRGKPREYASHNPAGAMMVYALWLSLAVVIGTGLVISKGTAPWAIAAQQDIIDQGDWSQLAAASAEAGDATQSGGEGGVDLKVVHKTFANLLLVLAVLHVAGVGVESRLLRRNLVKPMVTGRV